jgi:hypothetical protein
MSTRNDLKEICNIPQIWVLTHANLNSSLSRGSWIRAIRHVGTRRQLVPFFFDNLHFEHFDKRVNHESRLTLLSKSSKWRLSKKRGLAADGCNVVQAMDIWDIYPKNQLNSWFTVLTRRLNQSEMSAWLGQRHHYFDRISWLFETTQQSLGPLNVVWNVGELSRTITRFHQNNDKVVKVRRRSVVGN